MTAPAPELRLFDHADDVVRLVARFEDGSLPKAEWTHQAHLAVGLWYAAHLPADQALAVVREGIQRINAAHGVATTPTGGYHETITRFYMRVICAYIASDEEKNGSDWAGRVNRLLARYGEKDLPLRHYTKDLLMSPAARFGWVEPDLRPIA
jgi:hypothetical protein